MESIDNEVAQRVWHRVRGGIQPQPDAQELLALIAGEWADASAYLQLSKQFSGREAAMLRRLYDQEQAHAACLKGIYTLLTGEKPAIRTPSLPREPVALTLRKCYGREMHCLAAYEARAADREYGSVFSRLAEQEREHCMVVLELLGRLQTGENHT